MGTLRVRVLDVTGSRSCEVEAPDDVPINRLLVLLVERMNLPLNSPDGQIMSYKLHLRRTGTQLLDAQTMAEAGVTGGDELRLQPEITAGAFTPRRGRRILPTAGARNTALHVRCLSPHVGCSFPARPPVSLTPHFSEVFVPGRRRNRFNGFVPLSNRCLQRQVLHSMSRSPWADRKPLKRFHQHCSPNEAPHYSGVLIERMFPPP